MHRRDPESQIHELALKTKFSQVPLFVESESSMIHVDDWIDEADSGDQFLGESEPRL
jgi:hypothetical protein